MWHRRLVKIAGALFVVVLTAAVLLFWWRPKHELASYIAAIDDDSLLAQVGLRKIGAPAILPLAASVADRFDQRPIQIDDLKRFRIVEQLVRDHPEDVVAIVRDPLTPIPIAEMLGTLAAGELTLEEQWRLAARWAEARSPWIEEVVFWLCARLERQLSSVARERFASGDPGMMLAAGIALVFGGEGADDHHIIRHLIAAQIPRDWQERAVRRLLNGMESDDLSVLERYLLEDVETLKLEILWALRYHDFPERAATLLRVTRASTGNFRRDCFDLLIEVLTDSPEGARVAPEMRNAIDGFLDDPDPALRADALRFLHPDRALEPAKALRVTRGISAEDLVDFGLYYFLSPEEAMILANKLAGSEDRKAAARFHEVVTSYFPPLPGSALIELIDDVEEEKAEALLAGLRRLPMHEARAHFPRLIAAMAERPGWATSGCFDLLVDLNAGAELTSVDREALEAILWFTVDPDRSGNIAIYLDQRLRISSARLATHLGGDLAARVLGALIGLSDGEEKAGYQEALDQLGGQR